MTKPADLVDALNDPVEVEPTPRAPVRARALTIPEAIARRHGILPCAEHHGVPDADAVLAALREAYRDGFVDGHAAVREGTSRR